MNNMENAQVPALPAYYTVHVRTGGRRHRSH